MLDKTGVNDKDDAIDCYRGLGDVRGQHNFPGAFWRRFEYFGLHIAGKVRVNWTDNQLRDFVAQCASCLLEVFMSGFNLFLTLRPPVNKTEIERGCDSQ